MNRVQDKAHARGASRRLGSPYNTTLRYLVSLRSDGKHNPIFLQIYEDLVE